MASSIGTFIVTLLLGVCAGALVSARAEERQLPLEKILNPMPDYDPFEPADSAPKYFPDAVDKRARELMIDALTNNSDALGKHVDSLKAEDRNLFKHYGKVSGLSEHAEDLRTNTIQDRERYLAAQRETLKNSPTAERRKYLEAIINRDDLYQSDQLMRQSSTNFWD